MLADRLHHGWFTGDRRIHLAVALRGLDCLLKQTCHVRHMEQIGLQNGASQALRQGVNVGRALGLPNIKE